MIFALLLFGCADDGSQCEQLTTSPRHYEAKLLCEADAEMALQSELALTADYPTVEARCVPVGLTGNNTMASAEEAVERANPAFRHVRRIQPRPR